MENLLIEETEGKFSILSAKETEMKDPLVDPNPIKLEELVNHDHLHHHREEIRNQDHQNDEIPEEEIRRQVNNHQVHHSDESNVAVNGNGNSILGEDGNGNLENLAYGLKIFERDKFDREEYCKQMGYNNVKSESSRKANKNVMKRNWRHISKNRRYRKKFEDEASEEEYELGF